MTDETKANHIGARIDAIEQRIEDRSVVRDQQAADTREDIANLSARSAGLEGAIQRIETLIERNRPPGIFALLSPALGAAVVVGSLGGFVLTATVDPVKQDQKEDRADIRKLRDVQYDQHGRLAYLEGRSDGDRDQLNDVDKIGPRSRKGWRPEGGRDNSGD